MGYHLENKIILNEESEDKATYPWSLQEFDKNDQKIGSNQIPFIWSLYFTASGLSNSYSLDLNGNSNEENEHISAKLHPGRCRNGKWELDASYSMFGTDRIIKNFELCIRKIEEDKDNKGNTKSFIWGTPSSTEEIDCRNETFEDIIIIYLYFRSSQFYELTNLIEFGRVDTLEIHLSQISGFYSECTPMVNPSEIKILTNDSKIQKVIISDSCKIEPPRLGYYGKFKITIAQFHNMNLRQNLGVIDIDHLSKKSQKREFSNEEEKYDKKTSTFPRLVNREESLNKLSVPLWLIFIALCILLLK